ncbi:helix-turn-helix transcriptional regulator [Sphingomonas sp. URHD0057]|uniref:helix-turn-helix transcriptional regulator n=1 Tax=Sphingomonas sp. URHD0057 TaxID=1380389 RepID=UPI0004915D99|nr:helix-turn-helix transcriptional regulator [Sphingomonas sp. URHD0057]
MATAADVLYRAPETFSRSLFGRPSSGSYRAAVAQVIREVKARHKLSNERVAELVGCSEQTIANAETDRAENNLNPVTLLNIAYAFGEEAIEPVRALYLCAPTEEVTAETRLNRIEREVNALRKEIDA